ncbi:MAG TPA: hypothetical protein VFC56_13715 [Stellaceae bacterium]|nr:hypothetical protein [Stellaceae bacterium]
MGHAGQFLDLRNVELVKLLAKRIGDPERRAKLPVAILQHKDKGQVQDDGKLCGRIELDLGRGEIAGHVELSIRALPHAVADEQIDIGVGRKLHRHGVHE